jgi:AAA+ ATPase superfamily predicted ATPase
MKFYDREEQLGTLRQMRDLSYEGYSRLTVVTGRRRIGKTTLIKEAYKDEPFVYLFVGKKSEAVLCKEFCEEFQSKTGVFVPPMNVFRDVFRFFMEEGKRRKYTLVFDEFQNFLEVNRAIYGDMQNWWDRYQKESHVNLVVSGSVFSLMERIFKHRKEPLYGRQDATVKLQAFPTGILKTILGDNAPGYTNDDLLALYTYTGGIPKYVELLVDLKATSRKKMIAQICKADSPLIEEGKKLLVQEFGKKYATYFSILQAISLGYNTQADIEDYLGGKSLGGQLLKLEETYELVRKIRPIWAKPKTQTVRYEINDVFLRFWFRYVEKNQRLIEIGQYPVLRKIMEEDYETYSGEVLERYFRCKLVESLDYRDIGGWWDPKGYTDQKGHHQQCELDIVAQRLSGKVLDVFEIKRNPKKFDRQLLQEKLEHFKAKEKTAHKSKIEPKCLTIEDM